MTNTLMTITPYYDGGFWVFDDPAHGLVKEPFIAGVPAVLERLCAEHAIPDPRRGFRVIFSATPFPGHQLRVTRLREEGGGHWYAAYDGTMEGWLCPAMFHYFEQAPESLYLQVLPRAED